MLDRLANRPTRLFVSAERKKKETRTCMNEEHLLSVRMRVIVIIYRHVYNHVSRERKNQTTFLLRATGS